MVAASTLPLPLPPSLLLPAPPRRPPSLPLPRPACSLRAPRAGRGGGVPRKSCRLWRIRAAAAVDGIPAEVPVEQAQAITQAAPDDGGGGVSTVVSALLFLAFVSLSILTVGVIYLAVQDFLQKREREKFEEEAAERRKKEGKKGKAKARAGPRGFGQKLEEDED